MTQHWWGTWCRWFWTGGGCHMAGRAYERRPGREGAWVRCPASRRLWACTDGRRQGQGNFLGRRGRRDTALVLGLSGRWRVEGPEGGHRLGSIHDPVAGSGTRWVHSSYGQLGSRENGNGTAGGCPMLVRLVHLPAAPVCNMSSSSLPAASDLPPCPTLGRGLLSHHCDILKYATGILTRPAFLLPAPPTQDCVRDRPRRLC